MCVCVWMLIWCFCECVCLFRCVIMSAPSVYLINVGIQSLVWVHGSVCVCVWAHTQAHTSILVSSVCVPGLWKCPISGLEGRGPPSGDRQRQEDGPISALFSPSTPLLLHSTSIPLCHTYPLSLQERGVGVYQKRYFVNPSSLLLLLLVQYHHISLPPPHCLLCVATPSPHPPTGPSSQIIIIKKGTKQKWKNGWWPERQNNQLRFRKAAAKATPEPSCSRWTAHKKPVQPSLTRCLWPMINNCKQAFANMDQTVTLTCKSLGSVLHSVT